MMSACHHQTFPPAPWRLRGEAILQLQLLPITLARSFVPPEIAIVHVSSRTTVGGLYLASYGSGSTLQYHELIIVAGLVRRGFRVGAWISHIYVDEPRSVNGGRQIWALPKQLASFEQGEDGNTRVWQDGTLLCVIQPGHSRGLARLPVIASAFCHRNGSAFMFSGNGTARLTFERGEIQMPATSPLYSFGFGHGRRLVLQDLSLLLHEPRISWNLSGKT